MADPAASPKPAHRIELRPGRQHVRVESDGAVLAESSRPTLLLETGLPVRYYLSPDDVEMSRLQPSATRSRCPFKGEAVYWSGREGAGEDLAWSYLEPLEEVDAIRGLIAFFDERVDVFVDGERQSRPRTTWSRDDG